MRATKQYAAGLCFALAAASGALSAADESPTSQSPGLPAPSWQQKFPTPMPKLGGYGDVAAASVQAFIDWAGASGAEQREQARKAVWAARDNADVADALCKAALAATDQDHSRALVALALLGEMRARNGARCLLRVAWMPLPETGAEVEGEIAQRSALARLQAKAVEGLAYLRDPEADREVLYLIGKHPERSVRAAAINAYLWNHGDTADAKRAVAQYVPKGEEIFLDRIRRESGETAKSFNPKLQAYLKAHPELLPPEPEKAQPGADEQPYEQQPPQR